VQADGGVVSRFTLLAGLYPQYERVVDIDAARRNGVSIADAMEDLRFVAGGDVQAGQTFQKFAQPLSNLLVKNDRGEMAPYGSFVQVEEKRGLNGIDR
jgi:HAE1 family hydrophobic/amphiphilic exporter-1